MKKNLLAMTMGLAGLAAATKIEARPADSITVKIPFAFTAAHQLLPAGIYRIEFLTQGEPGVDPIEVVALRGLESGSYASLLARLGKSDATSPVVSFVEEPGANAMAEVRANGRSLVLNSPAANTGANPERPRVQVVSDNRDSMASATPKQN
jgi:hypothetical protein